MREALNLESGLNDGICVPIVVLLLGLGACPSNRVKARFVDAFCWGQ
jgi:NhaP-type Na+/H+ or K+/H+ antiporter